MTEPDEAAMKAAQSVLDAINFVAGWNPVEQRDTIAQALRAERGRATQWQPMETAPKDGTDVLLFFPLDGLKGEYFPQRIIAGWRNDIWVWQGRAVRGYSEAYQPTHWMPLPPNP